MERVLVNMIQIRYVGNEYSYT